MHREVLNLKKILLYTFVLVLFLLPSVFAEGEIEQKVVTVDVNVEAVRDDENSTSIDDIKFRFYSDQSSYDWSPDFENDSLSDVRHYNFFTVVDLYCETTPLLETTGNLMEYAENLTSICIDEKKRLQAYLDENCEQDGISYRWKWENMKEKYNSEIGNCTDLTNKYYNVKASYQSSETQLSTCESELEKSNQNKFFYLIAGVIIVFLYNSWSNKKEKPEDGPDEVFGNPNLPLGEQVQK